jgi:hypothetical protein
MFGLSATPKIPAFETVSADELEAFRAWKNSQAADAQTTQSEAKDAVKTEPEAPTASASETASASGPALDEDGFAVEAVSDGGANPDAPIEVENGQYQGIGGPNGVIPGESRTRLS